MAFSELEHRIPGGYQLNAILHGWRFQRAWHRARLDLLDCVLPLPPAGLVLDAACGSGLVTWFFRSPRVISVDMRLGACDTVRRHTPRARTSVGDVQALPFSSTVFAQAYLLEAIEHMSGDEGVEALRELHRVCRPGARCLITTPNYHSYWPMIERAIDVLGLTPRMGGEGQHVARYDAKTLNAAVEAAGWSTLRSGSFNFAAPLFGMISKSFGSRITRMEATHLRTGGALLFIVCQRQ